MILDTVVNKEEFIKTQKKIFKLKQFITLFTDNENGYIVDGKIFQNNAYYFGMIHKKNNHYRLLSNLEFEGNCIEETYDDYIKTTMRFIKDWNQIKNIILKGD